MGIVGVERKILRELREVTGLKGLKVEDFTEWRTVEFGVAEDEKVVFLPVLGVWASYRLR